MTPFSRLGGVHCIRLTNVYLAHQSPEQKGVITVNYEELNIFAKSAAYDRRRFLRQVGVGAAAVAGGALLEACGSTTSTATTTTAASSSGGSGGMSALISKAKGESQINLIALPDNWANYGTQSMSGTVIGEFFKAYGLTCNSVAPDDSSAEELTALTVDKNTSKEPDVVDVSPAVAATGVTDSAFAPYKVSTWDTIPTNMKDPSGLWYGDYYGVQSFGTNTKVVKNPPLSFSDLTKAEYKGQVAIDGNPASAGDALAAVWAASLANGGSLDDIMPGITFFKDLKSAGNFNPTDCYPANIASGATPIAIVWDYLNLGYKKQYTTFTYDVSIPTDGKFGNFYCQAISAWAPHPSAAQLWEEFIYSDQGQLLYLTGYAHPARYTAMAAANAIPASLAALLPSASQYTGVQFPNLDQITKASATVTQYWNSMVGGS
jgi:putative spermidine/putrescine transport system substrate-binding protein